MIVVAQLFETPAPIPSHPAKFSFAVLARLAELLAEILGPPGGSPLIFDPFGGVGTIHRLGYRAVAVDLEREWIAASRGPAVNADALRLPFRDGTFAALVTSPTYANRMADNFEPSDTSVRMTYRQCLGRPLSYGSSAVMQWGGPYRAFHLAAWAEAARVVTLPGLALVNVSDHVRAGQVVPVVEWHCAALEQSGWHVLRRVEVLTPRMGYGANRGARVESESVIVAERKGAA